MNKEPVVVVLSAGIGKRFAPLLSSKDMFPFLGSSLLELNLKRLENAGFRDIVIVCNSDDQERIENFSFSKLRITTVVQSEPKGMADAISHAKDVVGDRSALILNAEDVVDPSLYTTLYKQTHSATAWIVGKEVSEYFDGGYVVREAERVVGIMEKPGAANTPSDFVNLVFHFFPDMSVFASYLSVATSKKDDQYEMALTSYMKDHVVSMIEYDGAWAPLKYPWHVLDVTALLLSQLPRRIGKNVKIKKNVIIDGNVYIEDNVTIYENTKITGPCFIGEGSIIGNNNIVRDSHIGRRSVTGFNTDITRSYIGDDCWFHSNYVGDSVLESDISMGSGSVLANLRLDEGHISSVVSKEKVSTQRNKCGALIGSHVRIGVNVSTMPGIKIGAHTSIGAGLTITEDVPEHSFCVGNRPSYTVKKNTRTTDIASREQFRKKI
jgi:NDP-sugar pyrophosphorylase family protein